MTLSQIQFYLLGKTFHMYFSVTQRMKEQTTLKFLGCCTETDWGTNLGVRLGVRKTSSIFV